MPRNILAVVNQSALPVDLRIVFTGAGPASSREEVVRVIPNDSNIYEIQLYSKVIEDIFVNSIAGAMSKVSSTTQIPATPCVRMRTEKKIYRKLLLDQAAEPGEDLSDKIAINVRAVEMSEN